MITDTLFINKMLDFIILETIIIYECFGVNNLNIQKRDPNEYRVNHAWLHNYE